MGSCVDRVSLSVVGWVAVMKYVGSGEGGSVWLVERGWAAVQE